MLHLMMLFWLCSPQQILMFHFFTIGPSTKLLHSLYSKISQYTELTNHTMRFNAFIFGLLK